MDVFERIVAEAAEKAATRIVRKTVRYLQSLPAGLSGEDSDLANAWNEVCVQVQFEHSFFWDAYVLTIKQGIEGALFSEDQGVRLVLWLQTDDAAEWLDDEASEQSQPTIADDVVVDYVFDEFLIPFADNYTNERIRRYLDHYL